MTTRRRIHFYNPEAIAAARVARDDDALRVAARALLDWAREHTSPRDPNSPHDLLVALARALDPEPAP